MKRIPQPSWMAAVKVGDVLRSGSKTLRVVRKVSRFKDGSLRSVTFSIRHCSWTRRPYTVMGYTDLRLLGYARVGANLKLESPLDRELALDIADHNRRQVTCCMVKGIA
jgi:hypothetical protein